MLLQQLVSDLISRNEQCVEDSMVRFLSFRFQMFCYAKIHCCSEQWKRNFVELSMFSSDTANAERRAVGCYS